MEKTLKDMKIGEKARVARLELGGAIGTRLRDIGLIEGTLVECVLISPPGDPSAYLIRGAVMAIRGEDGRRVIVYKE